MIEIKEINLTEEVYIRLWDQDLRSSRIGRGAKVKQSNKITLLIALKFKES